MASGPKFYVNSPASGTQYFAPMGYGCIPSSGASVTVTVKAWSGPNGTGSSVVVSSLEAVVWDQTTSSQKVSFSGNYAAVTATTSSFNGTDWCKPSGKYTGSGVGSLEISVSSYSGAAFVPSGVTFTPSAAPPGNTIAISGTHLTDATSVRFNGVAASFTVNSDTSITATVPSSATYGPISVGNPEGSATSSASFEPGSIWIPNGSGGVTSPIAIWVNNGSGPVKIVGVWAPVVVSGVVTGVKRIW